MNFFARGRMLRGLYEHNKELQSALEHMEEELNLQIEKLQDENEYLKDELAYSRVRSNRLDEEIKTVRERDFKDIYPGLQAELADIRERYKKANRTIVLLQANLCKNKLLNACKECKPGTNPCPIIPLDRLIGEEEKDEVPTETTSEDS